MVLDNNSFQYPDDHLITDFSEAFLFGIFEDKKLDRAKSRSNQFFCEAIVEVEVAF
ncbi:MAG: hypothetical protein R8G66_05880 [Cytophagales bacterium]|nr:hypothetical protein [Cytophagales bacterium]